MSHTRNTGFLYSELSQIIVQNFPNILQPRLQKSHSCQEYGWNMGREVHVSIAKWTSRELTKTIFSNLFPHWAIFLQQECDFCILGRLWHVSVSPKIMPHNTCLWQPFKVCLFTPLPTLNILWYVDTFVCLFVGWIKPEQLNPWDAFTRGYWALPKTVLPSARKPPGEHSNSS